MNVLKVKNVPNYVELAIPWFYALIVLDVVSGYFRGKLSFEVRDSIGRDYISVISEVKLELNLKRINYSRFDVTNISYAW